MSEDCLVPRLMASMKPEASTSVPVDARTIDNTSCSVDGGVVQEKPSERDSLLGLLASAAKEAKPNEDRDTSEEVPCETPPARMPDTVRPVRELLACARVMQPPASGWRPYEETKAWARQLNLPDSTSACWLQYVLSHDLPADIPVFPSTAYAVRFILSCGDGLLCIAHSTCSFACSSTSELGLGDLAQLSRRST